MEPRLKMQMTTTPVEKGLLGDVSQMEDYFWKLDSSVIAEIVMWMLSPTKEGEAPTVRMIRDVNRFSQTSKRMMEMINRPPQSIIIWRIVDIGRIIREMTAGRDYDYDRRMAMKNCIVEGLHKWPQIAWCGEMSMNRGLTNSHDVTLISSMPNLMDLEVQLHGPNGEEEEKRIGGREVMETIGKLKNLTRLRIDVDRGEPVEMKGISNSRSIKELEVEISDASQIFEGCTGSFEFIKSLSVRCNTGIRAAILACPSVASLKLVVEALGISREEMKEVWRTCTQLEEISIRCWGGSSQLALEEMEKSESCKVIKKLSMDVKTDEERTWERMIGNCPNIVELKMWNPVPTAMDIRRMTTLKNLEVLDVYCRRNDEGYSGAFSELGGTDGKPFKKIMLRWAGFDLSGFLTSRRCHQLREIEFNSCNQSEGNIEGFAENVRDSLVSLEILGGGGELVIPLLARCSRLNRLVIDGCADWVLERIGKESKAPLTMVKLIDRGWKFTDSGLIGIAPALKDVIDLEIYGNGISTPGIVELCSKCHKLRRLKGPFDASEQIRAGVRFATNLEVAS